MRKLFGVRSLVVTVALASLGLVGADVARAQGTTVTTFSEGGTVAVTRNLDVISATDCNSPHVTVDLLRKCIEFYEDTHEFSGLIFLPPPTPLSLRAFLKPPRSAAASGSSTFDLTSSVPSPPFLGNRLVVISYVANNTNISLATAAYAVGLRRQADCSLNEDLIDRNAATPSAAVITSLPSAQDYFHQLAGLTTTPDVYPHGCNPQVLGLPSTANVLLLGVTSSGAAITAELSNSGVLQASVTDIVANTSNSVTVGTNINGGFAAADLNADGVLDLVGTFATDPVTGKQATVVFLGNGDGTFKPGVYYDVPGDVTIDDVTGDGKPDIVVLTNPGVTTLIGKGDGTFTIGPVSATSRTIFGQAAGQVLTGDFNKDGNKDLLADGTVLLGAGDGTFTVGSPLVADASLNFSSSIPAVAVGDLRNSGKLDVVVSQPGFVAIFYGNGDGTFHAGPRYAALPEFDQVTVTDVDGDGNPDIVLGTGTNGIFTNGSSEVAIPLFQILLGRGDGSFVDSLVYNEGSYTSGGQDIAIADFNGDTNPDVIVLAPNSDGGLPGSLLLLPGDGTGNLGAPIASSVNMEPSQLVVADMNHDGKPDVVAVGRGLVASANAGPLLSVFINQGNGTFSGEKDYQLPNSAVSLAMGDFNGDGRMDVAVGVASPGAAGPTGVYVLFGQADGTLGTPVQIDGSLLPTGLAAGDLNGDGRTDLIVADQGLFDPGNPDQVNGALHVYLGNANGTFTAATAPITSATNYSVAALGDLNNDGKLDLILAGNVAGTTVGGGTPNVYTLIGNGDGTFKAANTLALSGTDGIGATSIALADLNKDGNLDVVVGNPFDFTELLAGNGDGTLIGGLLALGQQPATVAAGDLNKDGFPELFVGAPNTSGQGSSLTVFLNANAWSPATSTLASTTTTAVASPNPSTVGQSVTLTATVSSLVSGTITGTVSFFDGSTPVGSATTLSAGSAAVSTSALTQGSHSITPQYSGDSNFASSTSVAITQVVNAGSKASTSTSVTTSQTPAAPGVNVTFTAVVSTASGTPTGTVTFMDGATSLGSGTLSSGKATFSTTTLTAGSHSITAIYGGDTNFSPSTSNAITQIILKPTTTVISSSINPSVAGQAVTFTATVTGASGTPTGTVTFFDGNTSLGPGTLNSSGMATLSTSTLVAGGHSITAVYGGDATFNSSTSTAVSQAVAGFAPVSGTATVVAGQSVPISLTVFGSGGSFALSCVGAPTKSTCSFSPNPVTPIITGTPVTLTFATSSSNLPPAPANRTPWQWDILALSAVLAALLTAGIIQSRYAAKRRLAFGTCLAIVTLLAVLAGCAGSSGTTNTGTPKGTATFTVTGTSGAATISTQVSVTVQ